METDYFTKMLYLKNNKSSIKRMSKSMEAKKKGEKIASKHKKVIFIKIRKRVFYSKLVHFLKFRAYFRPFMHAMIGNIVKKLRFYPFSSFFLLILLLPKKTLLLSFRPRVCTAVLSLLIHFV